MDWLGISTIVVAVLNFLMLLVMIFVERKKTQSIMSWLFIMTILPIGGFIIYLLAGSGLSIRTRRMFKRRKIYAHDYLGYIENIEVLKDPSLKETLGKNVDTIKFYTSYKSLPLPYNKTEVFLDGTSKVNALEKDLLAAKKSINIEYYIFHNDEVGKRIMNILCQKSREGVKVKLIFDSVGCLGAPRRFFRKLKKAGGEVAEFFPPFGYIRLMNLKVNYRNHRKIVVIDGTVAYTGGVNIRDDHMGKKKKLSPWRDTHIRIEGSGAYGLQNVFFNDWRYCKKDQTPAEVLVKKGYFPKAKREGDVTLQIVTSGPDDEVQRIKEGFVKMIANAKERVYIQTPYFVPDDVFMTALNLAVRSGIDVRIMLPAKPDRKWVHLVTLSFAEDAVKNGVKVYLYNGFLHSKTMIIDDEILSVGTSNIDNRSFELNFEVQTILYSKRLNKEYEEAFLNDMKNCCVADEKYFKDKNIIAKVGKAFFRLLSPLL